MNKNLDLCISNRKTRKKQSVSDGDPAMGSNRAS